MRKWVENWVAGKHTHYRRVVKDVLAFRYGRENEPEWYFAAVKEGIIEEISKLPEGKLAIHNKNNITYAWPGDWIVAQSNKEINPCHHDEFIDLFEPTPEFAKVLT